MAADQRALGVQVGTDPKFMLYACTSEKYGSFLCFPATGMKNNDKTRVGFRTWLDELKADESDCLRRMEFGLKPETLQTLEKDEPRAWEAILTSDKPTDCFRVRNVHMHASHAFA